MSAGAGLRAACAAAVAASVGDLLMLAVANAGSTEPGLDPPAAVSLALGAVLGVLGIPLYYAGYRAASQTLARSSPGAARLVLLGGAGTAGIGAFIHGLTAFMIRRDLEAATPVQSPLEAVVDWGVFPVAAWSLAALCVLVASVAMFRGALSHSSDLPRWWGWTNPAFVTVAIAASASGSELGRSFLAPAAPNLAHVVFFACSLAALRSPSQP